MPGLADDLLQALARSSGTIADSSIELLCPDVAAAVAQVATLLEEGLAIPAADCIGFACANDLPSAIVLIALLASGRTFVLLPPATSQAGAGSSGDAPQSFIRYRLTLGLAGEEEADAIRACPGLSLAVAPNPGWQAGLPEGPPSFLVATSGSTARAKLVQHRHDRLLLAAERCKERIGLTAADRIALPVPIAHMFGLGAAFLPAVLAGASIDLQPNANALRYLARERQFDPTVAFLAPSFAEGLLLLRKTPRRYRLTVMAGDRMTADLFDRYETLHGCLVNLYGSTELGVVAAGDPVDAVALRRDVIGRPMPGVAIWPEAETSDVTVDPDGAGLLWLQSDTGFVAYVDEHGRAVQGPDGAFASGGSFCSNDVGRLIDGYLEVLGRGDDLVNRDGLLTACSDVAAELRTLPGIADAVILGGDMSPRGRALVAFCVASSEIIWEATALRKACRDVLPSRSIPDTFIFVPEFPRLPSGKVDRMALRRRHLPERSDIDAGIR